MPSDSPCIASAGALREQLRADNVLFFRGLLEPDLVLEAGERIRSALREIGWLPDRAAAPGRLVGRQEGSEGWWSGYARVQSVESFHALAFHPVLLALQRSLVDAPFVHPRKIASLLYPNFAVPLHQDYPSVQGTTDVLTLWVPLVTLPSSAGTLRVLRQSEARRVLPLRSLPDAGAEIDAELPAGTWASYEYAAGDVAVLHSLTVHEVTVNRGDELALAAEYRFQSRREPVCAASLEPHHYPRVPGFRRLTRGWRTRRWVGRPLFVRRSRFVMPQTVETWHRVLDLPSSSLVPVAQHSLLHL
jgi:Phytanoyl-CoA dioxygenase (PhyH)